MDANIQARRFWTEKILPSKEFTLNMLPTLRRVRIRPYLMTRRYTTIPKGQSELPKNSNEVIQNINLRSTPFSKRNKPMDWLKLPLDTYPNPLFSMTKAEILKLTEEEFFHLRSIAYKTPEEQALLCANIILIIDESIIVDPQLAMRFLGVGGSSRNINSNTKAGTNHFNTLEQTVISSLKEKFSSNSIKLSILHYILEPTLTKFKLLFMQNLDSICQVQEAKEVILLNYLNSLVNTNVTNAHLILLSDRLYHLVIRSVSPDKFYQLFLSFVQLNVQTEKVHTLEKLKKTLLNGSPMEKFVVRTGWHHPKWHDTLAFDFTEEQQQKMLQFFTIKDFKIFTETFVKLNDIVNSNVYLNLLIAKLEYKTLQVTNKHHHLRGDSELRKDIHTIIQVALQYFMTFKGPSSCLKILKYMMRNDLEINFDILLIIIKQLDRQRHFQEALQVINNVLLVNLSGLERFKLVEEILILIKKRYPKTPEVMVGYVAAMLNGEDKSANKSLALLNDLKLLGITHGNGKIGSISSFELIQKANIDERLTGFEFSSNSLANYYEMVLHLMRTEVDSEFIYELFVNYLEVVKNLKNQDVTHQAFGEMNDRVVYHLINFLLRKRPRSLDFKLHEGTDRMNTAKKIFLEFTTSVKLPRRAISTSIIDLLIYSSLIVHKDFAFAAQVLKYSRTQHVPFAFNQIYPFVKYHYLRKEYDRAHIWYKELVKHAIVTTAQPAKEVFQIARELNWEVNGFVYRKANIMKNRKAREDLENVKRDPLVFFQELPKNLEDIDDEDGELMTDELITGTDFGNMKADFVSELSSMIYQAQTKKS